MGLGGASGLSICVRVFTPSGSGFGRGNPNFGKLSPKVTCSELELVSQRPPTSYT